MTITSDRTNKIVAGVHLWRNANLDHRMNLPVAGFHTPDRSRTGDYHVIHRQGETQQPPSGYRRQGQRQDNFAQDGHLRWRESFAASSIRTSQNLSGGVNSDHHETAGRRVICENSSDQKPSWTPISINSTSREMAITISGDIITTNSMPLTNGCRESSNGTAPRRSASR